MGQTDVEPEESTEDNKAKARMLRNIGDVHEKKSEYDRALDILAKAKSLITVVTAE